MSKKLGIKEDFLVTVINPPTDYYSRLEPIPFMVAFVDYFDPASNLVHLFIKDRKELAKQLSKCREKLRVDAVLWISWPKKSSNVATDITEDTIRELALPLGWVDIKVCAVDDVWSGLKLVVRKKLR